MNKIDQFDICCIFISSEASRLNQDGDSFDDMIVNPQMIQNCDRVIRRTNGTGVARKLSQFRLFVLSYRDHGP